MAPDLLWNRTATPMATLLLAHGAGAAMDSPWMTTMSGLLADRGIQVARFEFAYMAGRRSECANHRRAETASSVNFGMPSPLYQTDLCSSGESRWGDE